MISVSPRPISAWDRTLLHPGALDAGGNPIHACVLDLLRMWPGPADNRGSSTRLNSALHCTTRRGESFARQEGRHIPKHSHHRGVGLTRGRER